MTAKKIRVIQFGVGPIGQECARWCLQNEGIELVGAVDIDPEKAGKPLEVLIGIDEKTGIKISPDVEKTLEHARPDVALHTTGSSLQAVFPQIETLCRSRVNVVSSTEELLVPELRNPDLARKLNELATECGVTVLGTGVNPGFVMDTLPLCLSSMCLEVRSIRVRRELDAGKRRLPLQKKVGVCLSPEEFQALKEQGRIGHVGLVESMDLLLQGLGWIPDRVLETLEPVVADRELATDFLTVKQGEVCGIKHVARARKDEKDVVVLDLRMYIGAPESFDMVEIEGTPPIRAKFEGGIHGDRATVAALVNAIPRVKAAPPGLKTMKELALPYAFNAFRP